MDWRYIFIIFIVLWIIVGVLSTIWLCVECVKKEDIDEEYLDEHKSEIIMLILYGCATLLSIIIYYVLYNKKEKKDINKHNLFTKFIYKLVNINTKKRKTQEYK